MLSSFYYLAFACAIFTTLLFQVLEGTPRIDPLVQTKLGLIRGLKANDGDYSMFLGVPFGKVDEENPFGPAEPYPAFEEIFEANDDSAICPQIEEFNNTFVGDLDCLHLNIYVPSSASSKNRLPVLVWIYGGGFSIGFAGRYLYGPKFLVRHDIILVTLNYRLGPYGFMCLDTPEFPGNQGLKDQRLALRWIKEHVESFGGDADKITIFGESAGGMSVDFHVRYGKENLFNKAIMESGTTLIPGLKSMPNQDATLKLSAVLGFETQDLSQSVSFLSTVDPKLVIAAVTQVRIEGAFASNPFVACIEKEFESAEAFVTEDPVNQEIPKTADMKILVGYNNDEMGSSKLYAHNPNVFHDELKLDFDFDDVKLNEMGELVKNFYSGDDNEDEEKIDNITNFLSDFTFNHPTQRSIESFIKNGVEEVYHYVFSYKGGRNFVKRNNNDTSDGASHADEVGYLFDISFWDEDPEPADKLVVDQMTTMWANFAKYGDPIPEISDTLPVKWEPITQDSPIYYLEVGSELSLKKRPFNQRLTFWDLFYKANEQYYIDYSKRGEE